MNHSLQTVGTPELERLLQRLEAAAPNPKQGLFGPQSISWQVNRESALFLAAGRATLLQLAHPWVAAAIAEHSTTLRDPVARFHNTFRVMFTLSFGSLQQAAAVARQLHRRHQSIRGAMPDNAGPFAKGSSYEANELGALRWVYATLIDSTLLAYNLILPPLSEAEREQYYRESRIAAAWFGVAPEELPGAWLQFGQYFEKMLASSSITATPVATALAHELLDGAGTWLGSPGWYRAVTAYLLPSRLRDEFQLPFAAREQRSAERAIRWLRRIYRLLPASVRFVGPYLEAQGRLAGKSKPSFGVRLSNRVWVGQL